MKQGLIKIGISLVSVTALFIVCLASKPTVPTAQDPARVVLIDPGHGGADGGAVAFDGTMEKDLNLSIALALRAMLQTFGVPTQMTRDTDVSIHDPSAAGIKQQKVSDMHNRLRLYEQATLIVGIHQNYFSVEKYSGTQLFYGTAHSDSRRLAETVRQTVVSALQPNNTRELKRGTDIYLLEHTTRPAIFVECGFLSNREECDRLQQESYQHRMALTIAVGIVEYMK